MPVNINFWECPEFEGFKRTLSWLVDVRTEALMEITEPILPHIRSIVVEKENKVIVSEEGGPANYKNIFSNLNFVNLLDTNTFRQLSFVPEIVTISNDEYELIKEKFILFENKIESMKNEAKSLARVSNPISNYKRDLKDIIIKQNIADVKKLRKYEKEMDSFYKNLKKTDWDNLQQKDYTRFESAMRTGKIYYTELESDYENNKALFQYPFVFHEDFKTDFERFVTPFFAVNENIDESYVATLKLFEESKNNSGFLRGPSEELRNRTVTSLNEFIKQFLTVYSGYDVSSSSTYDSRRVDMKKELILKLIDQKNEPNKLITNLLELIHMTNLVNPVLEKTSKYELK